MEYKINDHRCIRKIDEIEFEEEDPSYMTESAISTLINHYENLQNYYQQNNIENIIKTLKEMSYLSINLQIPESLFENTDLFSISLLIDNFNNNLEIIIDIFKFLYNVLKSNPNLIQYFIEYYCHIHINELIYNSNQELSYYPQLFIIYLIEQNEYFPISLIISDFPFETMFELISKGAYVQFSLNLIKLLTKYNQFDREIFQIYQFLPTILNGSDKLNITNSLWILVNSIKFIPQELKNYIDDRLIEAISVQYHNISMDNQDDSQLVFYIIRYLIEFFDFRFDPSVLIEFAFNDSDSQVFAVYTLSTYIKYVKEINVQLFENIEYIVSELNSSETQLKGAFCNLLLEWILLLPSSDINLLMNFDCFSDIITALFDIYVVDDVKMSIKIIEGVQKLLEIAILSSNQGAIEIIMNNFDIDSVRSSNIEENQEFERIIENYCDFIHSHFDN